MSEYVDDPGCQMLLLGGNRRGVQGMSQVQIGRWAPGFHNMSIMEGLCKLGRTDNDGCIKVPVVDKVDMVAFRVLGIDPRVVELGV